MTLYVDVIWLLNWLFDSLLLCWTAVLMKFRFKLWRMIAGGFAGSLIIVLAFTPWQVYADYVWVKLLFSVLMLLTGFGFTRITAFLKHLAGLYLVTFLSGGVLLGLHYMFAYKLAANPGTGSASINQYGDPVSWLFVLAGFPLAWQFSKKTLGSAEMAAITFNELVTVRFRIGDFSSTVTGLVDSGNQLYDPVTRTPVMIVALTGREHGMPEDMLDLFKSGSAFSGNWERQLSWEDRLRIIPCKVVGNDSQLLTAVKPDSLEVTKGKDVYEVKGLISFTMQQLSPDQQYQSIVHPKMLTGAPVRQVS